MERHFYVSYEILMSIKNYHWSSDSSKAIEGMVITLNEGEKANLETFFEKVKNELDKHSSELLNIQLLSIIAWSITE